MTDEPGTGGPQQGRDDQPHHQQQPGPPPAPTPEPTSWNAGPTRSDEPATSPWSREHAAESAGAGHPNAGDPSYPASGSYPDASYPGGGQPAGGQPDASYAGGGYTPGAAAGGYAASGGGYPGYPGGGGTTPPPGGPGSFASAGGGSRRPRRTALTAVAVLVAAVIGGGAGAAIEHQWNGDGDKTVVSSLSGNSAKNTSAAKAPDGSAQKVAAQVLPSVVSISVTQSDGSGDGGTGVLLSSDGQILTNNHVVSIAANGSAAINVRFNDGKTAPATILGRDPISDLAVIKAKGVTGATPAQLGSSGSLQVGQPVVAIGSPFGFFGTVTTGIVSAVSRPVNTSDDSGGGGGGGQGGQGQLPGPGGGGKATQPTVIDAIQTDAAINPGNSGGALVNMSGQVVGINQSIATAPGQSQSSQSGSIGLGFAIPIDEARPIAQELIKNGKATHAQLGVTVQSATSGQGVPTGAKLVSVAGGQAAAKAGLKQGDVVVKVDDREVDTDDALIAAVRSHRPGDSVTLAYTRDGSQHSTKATLDSDS